MPIVNVFDGFAGPADAVMRECLMQRNTALKRARQYRDYDLPWFKSHDPAEYEMQIQREVVKEEVCKARFYHRWALYCRSILPPKQASLL